MVYLHSFPLLFVPVGVFARRTANSLGLAADTLDGLFLHRAPAPPRSEVIVASDGQVIDMEQPRECECNARYDHRWSEEFCSCGAYNEPQDDDRDDLEGEAAWLARDQFARASAHLTNEAFHAAMAAYDAEHGT